MQSIKVKYGFIRKAVAASVKRSKPCCERNGADSIMLNPYLGIPMFILIMWLVFQATFVLSAPLIGIIESLFSSLGSALSGLLLQSGAPEWMPSLVENGIIAGVGSVLVFAPTIFILFFLMHALEDTGYVARISVLMDGIMGRTGLSGRAFIPLALGFGCNVPAIMATRILDTRQDRLATMAAIPFMSCSARLPVFTILAGAFFAGFEGSVLLFLYLFGVASGLATVFLFRRLVSRSGKPELAIELPDYQVPSWRTVFSQAWLETSEFVRRAGTIILASAVLIWFLASMPYGVEYGSRESFAGMLGSAIAPVFAPLGFGTWQSSISLLFGFVAKEVVVGAIASAYAAPEGELSSHLASHFSPLSAFSLMLFVLLYVPCLATLAALKKESKSISFTLGAAAYYMAFAWAVSFIVYNAGLALGF